MSKECTADVVFGGSTCVGYVPGEAGPLVFRAREPGDRINVPEMLCALV